MSKTTIFYENSVGFLSQWKGEVVSFDDESIVIKFSKHRTFKYRLKDLKIDFCLVTKKPMAGIGVDGSTKGEIVQFDQNLVDKTIKATAGNVRMLWRKGEWKQETN